ncbi:hypothetical protein L226DRAFT_615315 [Lentinus tigrinus ALCF2SS1-7]|uniref:NAD(P)-binding domain-containing protein n=1 Tax=Lentinus tigrinus ALCF2SS1-6 TaxID=1328759 RepID=A0A5C2S0Q0_9APHY|nr:hypothetical protein L227DRAFT_602708 [Lentinus tigrinus ALCF2SS1-6]RPD71810.1 hypothetical protein L226DRAFT_615315 [Lentinus tigrinus ALCF2SS1-7]
MRIILTGVTGVAGLAIYRAALSDPTVQQVTLLTRRAVPSWAKLPPSVNDKTETIIHTDFKTYPPDLARRLAEHDALIWALGRSAVGMSEEAYTELTYEYTLSAARALKEAGAGSAEKPFRFVFISGEHADPTGKSRQMWANVKGRVERELPELFEGTNMTAHIYRPGYFFPSNKYPEDRLNQRSALLRVADVAMGPLMRALMPSLYAPVEDLGRFAVEVAKGRWPQQILFRNADMRELMKSVPPLANAKHEEL